MSPHYYVKKSEILSHDVSHSESYTSYEYAPSARSSTHIIFPDAQEMQEAFTSRDTEALKVALSNMPHEEAQTHIQRCVDSGLWVPGGNEE